MTVRRNVSGGLMPAEVLVLVFVLALLVALVIPMLCLRRSFASRMVCGTNLARIGKAMLIYSNNYDDELPRAGGLDSQWTGRTPDWSARDCVTAFGLVLDRTGGETTVSASLYLLVKYVDVEPKTFLCRDRNRLEKGMREFRRGLYRVPDRKADLIDFWDFGPDPTRHVSYAYHMAYGSDRLTTSGEPGLAIAADRNPWMASRSAKAGDFSQFRPDIPPFGGTSEQARKGNSPRHGGDGQNVLFLDSHVEFAKRAYCGLDDDNIYTISGKPMACDPLGTPPTVGSQPANKRDSLLVNDPPMPSKSDVSAPSRR
jgi:prepilin-type processing-associated H-X9-DG protein